ncbi:UNVERIFIED_CONTAM: hypothetical protein FKN15_006554 [Acipenser sinensis]
MTEQDASLPSTLMLVFGPIENPVPKTFASIPSTPIEAPVSTPSPSFTPTGPIDAEALASSPRTIAEAPKELTSAQNYPSGLSKAKRAEMTSNVETEDETNNGKSGNPHALKVTEKDQTLTTYTSWRFECPSTQKQVTSVNSMHKAMQFVTHKQNRYKFTELRETQTGVRVLRSVCRQPACLHTASRQQSQPDRSCHSQPAGARAATGGTDERRDKDYPADFNPSHPA